MKSFHQGTSLGHTSIIQAQPFPVVILHSSLEAVRMGVAPSPSPAHHSPLSLRRSQGNSGAVQGTRHGHVGKWSPHTSAFSAPPPAPGLLRTTTPHPPPPVPSTHGSKQKLSREELLCSFHSGSAAAKKTSREHWAIPAPCPRGSCVS